MKHLLVIKKIVSIGSKEVNLDLIPACTNDVPPSRYKLFLGFVNWQTVNGSKEVPELQEGTAISCRVNEELKHIYDVDIVK